MHKQKCIFIVILDNFLYQSIFLSKLIINDQYKYIRTKQLEVTVS